MKSIAFGAITLRSCQRTKFESWSMSLGLRGNYFYGSWGLRSTHRSTSMTFGGLILHFPRGWAWHGEYRVGQIMFFRTSRSPPWLPYWSYFSNPWLLLRFWRQYGRDGHQTWDKMDRSYWVYDCLPVALGAVAFEHSVVLVAYSDIDWLIRFVNCVHAWSYILNINNITIISIKFFSR